MQEITFQAIAKIWTSFLLFLPDLILAILILTVGGFVSIGIGKLVEEILKKFQFDKIFEKKEWKEALDKAKIKIKVSNFIGVTVKWILLIIFLMFSIRALGLVHFADFLNDIVRFIPNVLIAALIFVVAVIMADFLAKIMVVATEKAGFKFTHLAGEIVKWSIWIFAFFAILIELGIARELLSILFTGIIFLIVISGGLAFGLGGKDVAADVIQSVRRKLKE